jgi:LAO/AO transport system kinase
MDAMGLDLILVETVGVGQDEIDIAQMAHTTVVVMVPGMGDDVQAIKAGILEVADVFAVNKADLDGADRVVRDLRWMLELRHAVRAPPADHDAHHHSMGAVSKEHLSAKAPLSLTSEWEPPILKVIAAKDQGLDGLASAIESHRAFLDGSGQRKTRERGRARAQFLALLRERLLCGALGRLERERGHLDEVASRIAEKSADPYQLAEELAAKLAG